MNLSPSVFRSYTGTGRCITGEANVWPCTFEIAQLHDGTITAQITLEAPSLFGVFAGFDIAYGKLSRIEGTSVDGRSLELAGRLHPIRFESSDILVFVERLRMWRDERGQGPYLVKFALTNLLCHPIKDTPRENVVADDVSEIFEFECPNGCTAALHYLPDAHRITKELKAWKGIAVTSELRIRIDSLDDLHKAEELADAVCTLLSFAQGCRVSWISYDVLDRHGTSVQSFHLSAITRRYSSLSVIQRSSIPLRDFLERTLRTYPEIKAEWKLDHIINAYTDAKEESVYLEARALQMVAVMELIRSRYLEKSRGASILEPAEFDKAKPKLKKAIRSLLALAFRTATNDQIELMTSHIDGMNWRTFGRSLNDLAGDVGSGSRKRDTSRFVDIRNELVHRYRFYEDDSELAEQYFFLANYISRVILGILKYKGEYLDWTKQASRESDRLTTFP